MSERPRRIVLKSQSRAWRYLAVGLGAAFIGVWLGSFAVATHVSVGGYSLYAERGGLYVKDDGGGFFVEFAEGWGLAFCSPWGLGFPWRQRIESFVGPFTMVFIPFWVLAPI